jgi:hypothetical protein
MPDPLKRIGPQLFFQFWVPVISFILSDKLLGLSTGGNNIRISSTPDRFVIRANEISWGDISNWGKRQNVYFWPGNGKFTTPSPLRNNLKIASTNRLVQISLASSVSHKRSFPAPTHVSSWRPAVLLEFLLSHNASGGYSCLDKNNR